MELLETTGTATLDWQSILHELGQEFASRATAYDRENTFVKDNYERLKEKRLFSAIIPFELGGGGLLHQEMCSFLRQTAHHCPSTALAFSMHQHLVAANVWKYRRGQGAEELLRKVAVNQLVLVSTGAADWLASNGKMEKTEGGYLVTAQKHFASQSSVGNILVTSAPYEDPIQGWQVLHFAVPFKTAGLTTLDNWDAMGMRGTGSHTVALEKVFVPDTAIVLRRPRGEFHPFWNVILTVAMPLIMSVYVGIAEKAAAIAISFAKKKKEPYLPYLLGEMQNELVTAQVVWQDMVRITNNLDFEPIDQNGQDILTRKTVVANACLRTVSKAMEVAGGQGYLRYTELEKLLRDVQAAHYHPLQEKAQHLFSGNFILGNRIRVE